MKSSNVLEGCPLDHGQNEIDFSQLGKQINRTVNQAINSVNLQELKNLRNSINATFQNAGSGTRPEKQPNVQQTVWNASNAQNRSYTQAVPRKQKKNSAVMRWPRKDRAGNAAGIILSVFGSIFLVVSVFGLLGVSQSFLTASSNLVAEIIALSIFATMFLGSGIMLVSGAKLIQSATRFIRYQKIFGAAGFCSIKFLADETGCKAKFIRKDLKVMVRRGLFPGAKFDEQETCLILNDETYQQYLMAQESRRLREQAEEERRLRAEKHPEIIAVMEEGKKYITSIREANDALPGVEVSNKLYRLEEIASKIFDYVEQHPNKLPDIRRFMSYYLPTSIKLVKAYREFEAQPVQGENLTAIKQEILETLDTINLAYENLLDRLFEDDTLDISTEISALETVLAQEGLTGDSFK